MSTDENVTMTSEDEEQSKKLAALLDTSHPLLQLLRERAPGTYKHSQALESIIEGLSAALDLDVTFMKVAALYHDIGKICNPKYFTENQLEDEDLHADLNPWISAQLIRAHVSDGANILINESDFPRELIEIITQHHGTNVMLYFYNKAGGSESDDYRYKGNKPMCVEAAVLMIADHVEATSRSLFQAGKFDPKNVIDDTIQKLIDDGQLDEVTMKLGDLKKIKLALAKELEGTYQKRVDYDEAKDNSHT